MSVGVKWVNSPAWLPQRHGPGLSWAIAVSVGLHAMLVWGWVRPHLMAGSGYVSSLPIHVRVLSSLQTAPTPLTESDATQVVAAAAPPQLAPVLESRSDAPSRTDVSRAPTAPSSSPQVASVREQPPATLAPVPSYRPAGMLERSPVLIDTVDPVYPPGAGTREGTVKISLLISASGYVDEVLVVKSSPPGYFEESTVLAFKQARFQPGYFMGVPVKAQMFLEVTFSPINRLSGVSGQGQ